MAGINKVILVGRLGKDPESKSFANGGTVTSFTLATSETWTDKQTRERKEKTEWHNVVIRNDNIGKIAAQYLRKGSQCYVEGSIQSRKWQDQNGADRYTTEIVIGAFDGKLQLLDAKQDGQRNDTRGNGGGMNRPHQPAGPPAFDDDLDSEEEPF